jgi:hypothetical protein
VFEVSGGSVVVGRDGVFDPVGESRDGDRCHLDEWVVDVADDLVAIDGDLVELGRREAPAVEDEQELRAALTVGAGVLPVDDEEAADG